MAYVKQHLTITEAANRCGCFRGSIHHAIKTKKIKPWRVYGLLLVDVNDVDRWNVARLARKKLIEKGNAIKKKIKEQRS